jgi:hypothetical protein
MTLVSSHADWDSDRLQICKCDAGYSGINCNDRLCPFGDDPETTCHEEESMVQRITMTKSTTNAYSGNSFALQFTDSHGREWLTDSIASFDNGASNIAAALNGLPNWVVGVDGVAVTTAPAHTGTGVVAYDVTFRGDAVRGNQTLLSCPDLMACNAPGCPAKFEFVEWNTGSNAIVTVNRDYSRPRALTAASTANQADVAVTFECTSFGGEFYWRWCEDTDNDGTGCSTAAATYSPMPSGAGRTKVAVGSYGLVVDFDSSPNCGSTQTVTWAIPRCEVTTVTWAGQNNENLECSGRGLCNRSSGQCECFEGYHGVSCHSKTTLQ